MLVVYENIFVYIVCNVNKKLLFSVYIKMATYKDGPFFILKKLKNIF